MGKDDDKKYIQLFLSSPLFPFLLLLGSPCEIQELPSRLQNTGAYGLCPYLLYFGEPIDKTPGSQVDSPVAGGKEYGARDPHRNIGQQDMSARKGNGTLTQCLLGDKKAKKTWVKRRENLMHLIEVRREMIETVGWREHQNSTCLFQ